MLQKLFVQNYAIIDQLEIEFSKRLTIITGETGAGKSILLGALGLILGNRASANTAFDKNKKTIVEGTFNIREKKLKRFFAINDLDYEEETIVRREITPSGKSRAFINDTPVNLTLLAQLGSQLINLHAQHQSLYLTDRNYQMSILDSLSKQNKELKKYQEEYSVYQEEKNKLTKIKSENSRLKKELDYIKFQANELEEAELEDVNEQQNLESELHELTNTEEIRGSLHAMSDLLTDANSPVVERLAELKKRLEQIADFGDKYQQLNSRLESIQIELSDLANESSILLDTVEADPQRAQTVQTRLDALLRLQNKHQVNSLQELIELREELVNKRDSVAFQEEDIKALEEHCKQLAEVLLQKATKISSKRKSAIPSLSKKVNRQLSELGMVHANIFVHIESNPEELTSNGIDKVHFLFASNKGSQAVDIKKAASGGELSRLMLAIQSLVAGTTQLPTLVFDEIDTGISGEVAIKVGKVLRQLSQNHQLICITHLPQIACIGETHYRIYKEENVERTYSQVEKLIGEDRIVEIGTILSGEPPSSQAKENARELLAMMNEV